MNLTTPIRGISDTAVLIFGRTPQSEASHKNYAGRHSEDVARELLRHTIAEVKASGLPYYICYDNRQTGASFGERLVHAIREVLHNGYDKVITVATDTPGLSSAHIAEAGKKLALGKIVFGPSEDGGIYLLAVGKKSFLEQELLGLSWGTARVQEYLYRYARQAGSEIFWLRSLTDIDSCDDLWLAFPQISRSSFLYGFLRSLLYGRKNTVFHPVVPPSLSSFYRIHLLRGPPRFHTLSA